MANDRLVITDEANAATTKYMQDENMKVTYAFDEYAGAPKGGVTIVWKIVNPDRKNSKLVEVAVAYCSTQDVFSKRVGRTLAVANFQQGQTIILPVGKDRGMLPHVLKEMFYENYVVRQAL